MVDISWSSAVCSWYIKSAFHALLANVSHDPLVRLTLSFKYDWSDILKVSHATGDTRRNESEVYGRAFNPHKDSVVSTQLKAYSNATKYCPFCLSGHRFA